jgi:translation initiation factor 1A
MPNLQGGKRYKSGKGNNEPRLELHEVDKDQMVGRVVRNLGQRRLLVYCNDNIQRICKIRGGLRKKTWFVVGDIVLISIRELGVAQSETTKGERGDVLAKYEVGVYGKLRKEYSINPLLFTPLENSGAPAGGMAGPEDEDHLEFEGRGSSSEDESETVDVDAI